MDGVNSHCMLLFLVQTNKRKVFVGLFGKMPKEYDEMTLMKLKVVDIFLRILSQEVIVRRMTIHLIRPIYVVACSLIKLFSKKQMFQLCIEQ